MKESITKSLFINTEVSRIETDPETGNKTYYIVDEEWECFKGVSKEEFKEDLEKLRNVCQTSWNKDLAREFNVLALDVGIPLIEKED